MNTARRKISPRDDFNGNAVIDGLTNLLTHTTSNTAILLHVKTERMKVHRQCLDGTLRYAGVAPLACRTNSMGHRRNAHPHLNRIRNRQKRVCCAGGNTGKILTELAGHLIGKNHRSSVRKITHDSPRWTGLDAIAAARAALKEGGFIDGAGRAQPIRTDGSCRLFSRGILMDSKFPRRLGHRDHGIFQEITTPVFGITGHVAPRLHDPVGTQFIDFYATVTGAILDVPARMVFADEI